MVDLTTIQSDASTGMMQVRNSISESVYSYQPGPRPQNGDKMAKDAIKAGTGLSFPADDIKYYMEIKMKKYERSWDSVFLGVGGDMNFDGATTVKLPLPMQIQNQLVAEWNEKPLLQTATAILGGVAGAAVAPGKGAVQAGAAAVGGAIGAAAGMAVDIAGAASGVAINKFVIITYSGPKYKNHHFQWKLVPRNPGESKQIKKIVKAFNDSASPSLIAGGVLFGYPKICKISYMPNSQYLYKFKPAVLTSVAANYTAGGQPAFLRQDSESDDINAPESVVLDLQFKELEYWTRGNYSDNNDPDDVYKRDDEVNMGVSDAIQKAKDLVIEAGKEIVNRVKPLT